MNADGNQFRLVDHRTIEYIILKGIKYSLAISSFDMIDEVTHLAVGNWFSGTRYLQALKETKANVVMQCDDQQITVSKAIVNQFMHSASAYEKIEHLSKTKLSKLLEEAGSTCFTVTFRTQVNAATMRQVLQETTETDNLELAK